MEEKYRETFMVAGFTNDQCEKVYNIIKIERSDAKKEALEEMKAAVELANVGSDKVGTFKDGQDKLKAQILYLLRSKLNAVTDEGYLCDAEYLEKRTI
jgi:hypothetical protein